LVGQRPDGEANGHAPSDVKDLTFYRASLDGYQTRGVGAGRWGRRRFECDQTEQHDSLVVAQRFVTCHEMRHVLFRGSDVMRHVLFRVTCHVMLGGWGHVAARQNAGFRQLVVRSNVAAVQYQWNPH
jgi:hypothetical protein